MQYEKDLLETSSSTKEWEAKVVVRWHIVELRCHSCGRGGRWKDLKASCSSTQSGVRMQVGRTCRDEMAVLTASRRTALTESSEVG